MRKILLTMFAAVALLGCNKEDVPVTPQEQHAISFGTVDTRAGLSDLQTNGFGVWAIINNDVVQDKILMNNQLVEFDEVDGWYYSPVQNWIDKTKFTFLATYPYDNSGTYFSYNSEKTAVELKVSETPSMVDFLVATNETDTSIEGYSTTVDLPFQHMLTSVGLKIWRDEAKHTNDQMRIRKVTLSNIRKGGTFTTTTTSWTYTNDKLTVEYVNNTLADTDNIGAAMLQDNGSLQTGGIAADPFGQMMLLPQTIDENNIIALRIEYEIKRNNAADWESAELEASIPNATWLAGNRYTYNVVLSSVTDITFYYIQTKVDPWGTPQVGGTVIIK